MSPPDPDAAFAVLREADPEVMDRDQLAELAVAIKSQRAWIDSLQVRVTRRQRSLADEGRAEAPKDLLAREGGQSGRDARTADDREKVCTALPSFEEALAGGGVSAGHIDAIASTIRNLDQTVSAEFLSHGDELLADAGWMGVDAFGQNCRELARQLNAAHNPGTDADELERQRAMSRVRRWTDKDTGMRHTMLELDPVSDATLWAAIDAHRRRLRADAGNGRLAWERLQVDSVIAAVSSGSNGIVVQLHVLIDLATLQTGLHAQSICELVDGTPLPVSTVRHMACEASIIPIVLDGKGQALDVGRTARLATEPQRQALRAMHRTCIGLHCAVGFEDSQVHHVLPWDDEELGPTDLENLAPLCNEHHHLVHEGGWTLTMTPDRIATWTRPDGTVYWTGSTIDRAPNGIAPPTRSGELQLDLAS